MKAPMMIRRCSHPTVHKFHSCHNCPVRHFLAIHACGRMCCSKTYFNSQRSWKGGSSFPGLMTRDGCMLPQNNCILHTPPFNFPDVMCWTQWARISYMHFRSKTYLVTLQVFYGVISHPAFAEWLPAQLPNGLSTDVIFTSYQDLSV